ncbi:hypothetical protein ACFOD1_11185 [Pseudidiomarina halophila]|uniref:hypothetical protein n=1 Tax=Pseudidiomarina halophila TaxID=1449799 RepID=UPI001300B03A|nr:hypothetical protein [Pseudidiomarina halophila]
MSLPWLRENWRQLVNEYASGNLNHAHCLPWQPDLGAEAFIKEWLKLLLCTQARNRACGVCKSCLLHKAGNHPDYYEVASQDGKVVSVDQIRELTGKLQQTPNQAGAKVVWLRDAERMSITAANALLKTLEEPTQSTYFVVSPERTERLLPTLRSRMQLHRFNVPDETAVAQWLAQQLERVLTAAEQQLCKRYHHRPLALLEWLENDSVPADYPQQLASALLGDSGWPAPDKSSWRDWLLATEHLLNELVRLKQGLGNEHLQLVSQQEQLTRWLTEKNYQVTELNHWLKSCYDVRRKLAEQSGLNGPLLLQELWTRLR